VLNAAERERVKADEDIVHEADVGLRGAGLLALKCVADQELV
jgi:hypothetical protein